MDTARSDQAQLRAAAGGDAEALSERVSGLFDDVALLVLPLLSLEVRARAACARKAWRVAAATPALLAELDFARCAAQVTDDALKTLCAHAGAELRTLRFDTCMKVTGEGVVAALHDGGCAGVRCINAPNAIILSSRLLVPGPLNLYYSSRWDVSTVNNDPLLYDGLLQRSVTSPESPT